jgi:F0F1-type ATP synthase assembly protein I
MPKTPKYEALRSASLLLAVPTILIAAPLVGMFLGRFADQKLGTNPWLTILGIVLGFVAAARQIADIVRRVRTDSQKQQEEDGTGR